MSRPQPGRRRPQWTMPIVIDREGLGRLVDVERAQLVEVLPQEEYDWDGL